MLVATIISESVDAKLFKKKLFKKLPKLFKKKHHGIGIGPIFGIGIGGGVEKIPAEYIEQPKVVEIVRHIPVIQKIEVIKPIEVIRTIKVPGKNCKS